MTATVKDPIDRFNLELVAGKSGLDHIIQVGYCGDMLSNVMGHAPPGCVWITILSHQNIVPVAVLHEMAAVVITGGQIPDPETKSKADENGIPILLTADSSYEFSGKLHASVATEKSVDTRQARSTQTELATLGQSISLLSHSIKNILEGLRGGAYVVDEGIKDNDMRLAQKGWNIVKRNINDITNVVQDILYSSKNRPLRYETLSPSGLIQEAIQRFDKTAESMGIQLDSISDPDLPAVKLDGYSIQRLLNNLILNALDACRMDKSEINHSVTVRAARQDQSHIMIEVKDNGIGMEEETKDHIFEEFYSTKGSRGTGLGLSVVDKIVNKHGGRIEIESTLGVGSIFRIIFNTS